MKNVSKNVKKKKKRCVLTLDPAAVGIITIG